MATIPASAQFLFPTGTDIYSTKVNIYTVLNEGPYTVALISGVPAINLLHNPLTGTSIITTPTFTQVTGIPANDQFKAVYSGTASNQLQFNSINIGQTFSGITYTAAGDTVQNYFFNDVQQSIDNIESFIINSGLAFTGTFVPLTGGTMTGNLVMSGSGIVPNIPSGSFIGSTGLPFASIYGKNIIANSFTDGSGNGTTISSGAVNLLSNNELTISGQNAAQIIATSNLELEAKNGTLTLNATNGTISLVSPSNIFFGNATPNGNNVFNLGSISERWATIYAENIDAPFLSGVVFITGSTMTGSLNIANPAELRTNLIENYNASLLINASGADLHLNGNNVSVASSNNIYITSESSGYIFLNNSLSIGNGIVLLSASIIPTTSGTYNIGSSANPLNTVYANNYVGLNLSGTFVPVTGGSMTGNLVMGNPLATGTQPAIVTSQINALNNNLNINVGELGVNATNNVFFALGPSGVQVLELGLLESYFSSNFIPSISGVYNLGSITNFINDIYANNIYGASITSGTITNATIENATITGNISIASGSSILAPSGYVTIGSSGNPITTIYATNIVTTASTGTYLNKYGDTMVGTLTIGTGSYIAASGSGISNIGSATDPFNIIYANNIVSTGLNGQYVPLTGGTMTGPLILDTITSTGTLTIFTTGTGNINLQGNQLNETFNQLNLTSTNGPIILNSNTELQQIVNNVVESVIGASGTELYNNIYPATANTYSVGTAESPFAAVYANNFVSSGLVYPTLEQDPFYRYNQQPLQHWVNNFTNVIATGLKEASGYGDLNYGTFDGENFWVGNFLYEYLAKIDQFGNVSYYDLPAGCLPLQLCWDNRYIWVGSANISGSLYQFDPTTNTIVNGTGYTLNPSGIGQGGIQGLIWDGNFLWAGIAQADVSGIAGLVVQVDPANGNILQTISNQPNVNGLLVNTEETIGGSQKYIWAACSGAINKINATNGTYQTINITGSAAYYRIAQDDSYIYAADYYNNILAKFSMSDLSRQFTVNTAPGPNVVAYDGKYIWVAGGSYVNGIIYIHDKSNGNVVAQITGNAWNGLVYDGTYMWGVDINDVVYKSTYGDIAGNTKIYESLMVMTTGNVPAFQMSTKQNALIVISGNSILGNSFVVNNSTNSTGTFNTFAGSGAGISNTAGQWNTAFGSQTLTSNTSGNSNIALGYEALTLNTIGNYNTAIGAGSLTSNTTGTSNTAIGGGALAGNTTGSYNVAIGNVSSQSNTTGDYNTSIGFVSLINNSTGISNTAIGYGALYNTVSSDNTSIGFNTLFYNTSGSNNVAIGGAAASYISGGSIGNSGSTNSIYIGAGTQAANQNDNNEIVIGYQTIGSGSNTVVIGNSGITGTYLNGNIFAGSGIILTDPSGSQWKITVTTSGTLSVSPF